MQDVSNKIQFLAKKEIDKNTDFRSKSTISKYKH